MPKNNPQKTEKILKQKTDELNQNLSSIKISDCYDKNLETLKELFKDDETFKIREFYSIDNKRKYCACYCNGLIDSTAINDFIIRPLMVNHDFTGDISIADYLVNNMVQMCDLKKVDNFGEVVSAVTYGDTLLFTQNSVEALLIDTKQFLTRSLSEPQEEKVLSGPREGFNENLMQNLSLVRRKMRTNKLKIKFFSFGKESNTQIAITYIDGIVNQNALDELYKRLKKIEIDAILESNYILEPTRDNRWSPFRTIGETERPDVLVGKMLEGRIGLIVDGSPVALTLPFLFIENFQSPEDYYIDIYEATFSRFLRMLGFFAAIAVPAIYIAIVAFHHELLPTALIISIAKERENVPLPAAAEAFIMLIVFYILRESGLRMPSNVGQAMSIVGALVIGQAAVQARLVAAPMIIIIAFTGITSLLVPKMTTPTMLCGFLLLALASMLGFLGITLGGAIISIHVLELTSFGVIQTFEDKSITLQNSKDTFARAPWQKMITRPDSLTDNHIRQKRM